MPRLASATCLLAASALVPRPGPAQLTMPDWIDHERLAQGEVLLSTRSEDRGTVTIELAIRIDADWQAIWQILTSCEISPEYVPHVQACGRIATEAADGTKGTAGAELFRQTVKPAFFLPKFEHVFRLDYFPPERIEVSHVSGPIDRMEGMWRLVADDDGSVLLLQKMTVNPGFPVPRFFVRNTLERDMPPVLREIRRRAEAAD